ncbi:MAG: hypothetical protein ACRC41_05250 [Sarcina sp.]
MLKEIKKEEFMSFIKVWKSQTKMIVLNGDRIDFEIHIKNIEEKALYNIVIIEEIPTSIDVLKNSLNVSGQILDSYFLSRGIKIKKLEVKEEVTIKYVGVINTKEKKIITRIKYNFQFYNFEKKEFIQGEVNSNEIKVYNIGLKIDKLLNKKIIALKEETEFIIKIKNIGDVTCYNINIKEDLCDNLEFIEGSFEFNEKKYNLANISKGVNIGILMLSEEVIIKYKAKVVNTILKSIFKANFKYSLDNDISMEYKQLNELNLNIKVKNPIEIDFIDEYFIALEEYAIREIIYIDNKIEILDFYIIDTDYGENLDGLVLTGRSLVIVGRNKILIEYLNGANAKVNLIQRENIFIKTIPLCTENKDEKIIKVIGSVKNIGVLIIDKGILIRDFIFIEALIRFF